MRGTPSRASEQPYTYYCYVHQSINCTEVILANNNHPQEFHDVTSRSLSSSIKSRRRGKLSDDRDRAESPGEWKEWKVKWAKAKRSARDTWRRAIKRQWTPSVKKPDEEDEDVKPLSDGCNHSNYPKHDTLPVPNTNRNGDVTNQPQWQQVCVPSPPTSRPQIATQYHRKYSAPLSMTAATTSIYECTNNSGEMACGNTHYNTGRGMDGHNGGNDRIGHVTANAIDGGGGKSRPGYAVIERNVAAPLAKPEPLTDLEKPAFDDGQYSKQASSAAPQMAHRFGSSTLYHQDHHQQREPHHQQRDPHHQKTIRFADEESDGQAYCTKGDQGVTSEAETSSIGGTNSAVRPHGINQPVNQTNDQQRRHDASHNNGDWTSDQMIVNRLGDASPGNRRRSLAQESAQLRQQSQFGVSAAVHSNDKTGAVFLQYQGETKRSALPCGQDGTTQSSLQSMNDVRMLFLRAFHPELTSDYVKSSLVKIYIQDPSKTDVFYELEDLSDVKDRAVLKLHECPTRPNSPPVQTTSIGNQQIEQAPKQSLLPPPVQQRMVSPVHDGAPNIDPNVAIDCSDPRQPPRSDSRGPVYNPPYHYHQHHSSSLADDMNYFSEPEFDASRDYRVRKSSSTSNYCVSPVYPTQSMDQQRRHYGTIDRFYGASGTGLSSTGRSMYRPQQVPPKPDRLFGPGVPSGGRASMRRSQSPPRNALRPAIGHSTDPEDAYGIRGSSGSRDYAPSPSSTDALMEALYNRPSSVTPRSGSATPVIDEEARIRMINMEKQLANLSSLVHAALTSKNGNESVLYKDLEMLRRDIVGTPQHLGGGNGLRDDLSDSGSLSRFSDISSDKGSYKNNSERDAGHSTPVIGNGIPEMATSTAGSGGLMNAETRHALKTCKRRVGEIQNDLKNLRRLAQLNAQSSRDVLRDAFDRIKVILNTNKHIHMFAAQAQQQNQAWANQLSSDRNWVDQEQDRYRKSMQRVERDLGDLERQVEELRQKVVSGERKLRMVEVEAFTEMLGQIGKSAAQMKTNFPSLQDRLRHVMSAEMEKVVKEEKFLKDEPSRVDVALKRCKKLTNTMVTMKKLAMVQDPLAYNANRSQSPMKPPEAVDHEVNGKNSTPSNVGSTPNHRSNTLGTLEEGKTVNSTRSSTSGNGITPTVGPKGNGDGGHVLDSLLEELQNVAKTVSVESDAFGSPNGIFSMGPNGSISSTVSSSSADNPDGVVNGNNGEKRVGFADEVRVVTLNQDGNSDTIKRAPKVNPTSSSTGYVSSSPLEQNGPNDNGAMTKQGSSTNGYSNNGGGQQSISSGSRRRSASPMMGNSMLVPTHTLMTPSMAASRSHSGTPCSAPSDPSTYHSQYAPPPPPRTSSRTMLSCPDGNGYLDNPFGDQRRPTNGQKNGTPPYPIVHTSGKPHAIIQTNAVDEELSFVKSGSSSDSVNSQDGRRLKRQYDGYIGDGIGEQLLPPGKPPPPPPPPRNKQEMLEQRQHELLTKQLQQQQSRYITKF